MPLTVEDEIFVERSFQRTLIELEKLISFSGTPTLVWRRTGEIVLVGTEFTLLSEWRREDLLSRDRLSATLDSQNASTGGNGLANEESIKEKKAPKGKKRYIFEIFDQDSLVEYYESFAQHAFESSSAVSEPIRHWKAFVSLDGLLLILSRSCFPQSLISAYTDYYVHLQHSDTKRQQSALHLRLQS